MLGVWWRRGRGFSAGSSRREDLALLNFEWVADVRLGAALTDGEMTSAEAA
jgi:hypothetical protein